MLNILIADDSLTFREMLTTLINRTEGMRVAGTAGDGEEAVKLASRLKPDVITMDVNMPKLNGIEATRKIMQLCPCPIVIVSLYRQQNNETHVFEALEAGALAVVNKPSSPSRDSFNEETHWLIRNIRVLSEVKVITRKPGHVKKVTVPSGDKPSLSLPSGVTRSSQPPPELLNQTQRLVLVGASTGGPLALQLFLSTLETPFPHPIVIVQHIADGFLQGLADWLGKTTGHAVEIAVNGQQAEPGKVYFAQENNHLGIDRFWRFRFSDDPPEYGLRPSVGYLFRNVAQNLGNKTIALLMTGMGVDGSAELKTLKDSGAFTIAQDETSSVVHGMPGEALRLGGAHRILNPSQMALLLNKIAEDSHNNGD